jgi:hypothetical protein
MQLASRIERRLPARIGEVVDEVQGLLDRLEREVHKASASTRREATRLLREASRALGKLEGQAEARGRRLASHYVEEASRLVEKLRKTIAAPATRRSKRKA